MSFDFSALPDSAVILRARLYLYQNSLVAVANAPIIRVYELANSFTESQVTWNIRKTAINWATSGATSKVASATGVQWTSSTTDTAVGTAVTAFVGVDTAAFGAYTTTSADKASDPLISRSLKTGTGAASALKCKGWTTYDITNLVRKSNLGLNASAFTGIVLTADEDGYLATGVANWFSSDFANKAYRPKVIVEYFDPTSSSSGGRRVIGNGYNGLH
jgi:hypothetical protein